MKNPHICNVKVRQKLRSNWRILFSKRARKFSLVRQQIEVG